LGFDLCESKCKGFSSPETVKVVELSIREQPTAVAVDAQAETASNRGGRAVTARTWVKGREAGEQERLRVVWRGLG